MPLPLDALLGFGQRLFRLRPDEAENALPLGLQASPVGCRQGRQHQHKTVRGRRLELVAESHLHPGQTPIWLRPMPFYYAQRMTLAAPYRILQIRAVPRRVALTNREHLCRFRPRRKSGTTENGSTGTTLSCTSFRTS